MLALNPWLLLAAGLALSGAIGGAYIKGRADGRSVEIAQRVTIEEVARVSREAASEAAAEKIAKIEVTNRTIYQKVERETRIEPRYVDCRNTEHVMQLINAALTGKSITIDAVELPPAHQNGR